MCAKDVVICLMQMQLDQKLCYFVMLLSKGVKICVLKIFNNKLMFIQGCAIYL